MLKFKVFLDKYKSIDAISENNLFGKLKLESENVINNIIAIKIIGVK